ncbi:MAG: hypothetical protein ACI8UG_001830 [Gammaproteobacteria bacterium]
MIEGLLVEVLSVMKIEHTLRLPPSRATGVWIFQTKSLLPEMPFLIAAKNVAR